MRARRLAGLSGVLVMGVLLAEEAKPAVYAVEGGKLASIVVRSVTDLEDIVTTTHDVTGSITCDRAKDTGSISLTVPVKSLDTGIPARNGHLMGEPWLNAEKFPEILFKSTGVKDATAAGAKLEGLLTLHGVEKPIVLDVTINGVGKDPWGNVRAAFSATTQIRRKDFGMNWNQALDNGGLLVGDDVKISLEIEGIEKQA